MLINIDCLLSTKIYDVTHHIYCKNAVNALRQHIATHIKHNSDKIMKQKSAEIAFGLSLLLALAFREHGYHAHYNQSLN